MVEHLQLAALVLPLLVEVGVLDGGGRERGEARHHVQVVVAEVAHIGRAVHVDGPHHRVADLERDAEGGAGLVVARAPQADRLLAVQDLVGDRLAAQPVGILVRGLDAALLADGRLVMLEQEQEAPFGPADLEDQAHHHLLDQLQVVDLADLEGEVDELLQVAVGVRELGVARGLVAGALDEVLHVGAELAQLLFEGLARLLAERPARNPGRVPGRFEGGAGLAVEGVVEAHGAVLGHALEVVGAQRVGLGHQAQDAAVQKGAADALGQVLGLAQVLAGEAAVLLHQLQLAQQGVELGREVAGADLVGVLQGLVGDLLGAHVVPLLGGKQREGPAGLGEGAAGAGLLGGRAGMREAEAGGFALAGEQLGEPHHDLLGRDVLAHAALFGHGERGGGVGEGLFVAPELDEGVGAVGGDGDFQVAVVHLTRERKPRIQLAGPLAQLAQVEARDA
ncbi:hypothetical protein D3C86_1170430 [compost metagenome]